MDALIKALRDFIFRDIIYVIGGVSVLITFLCALGEVKVDDVCYEKLSIIFVLYIAGIGYVLGWTIQTIFSIIHFVTTSQSYRPKWPAKWLAKWPAKWLAKWLVIGWLYRLFMYEKNFLPIKQFDQDKYSAKINEKAELRSIADIDRLTNHLQICTTLGPCAVVIGIILLLRCCCVWGIIILIFGGILMILARVIILRLTKCTYELYNEIKDKKDT